LISGIAIAVLAGWGLGRQLWVASKLGITAILTALAIIVLAPSSGTIADAATSGAVTSGQQLRLVLIPAVATAALIANVFLALYKPGRRARR
jgi:hypothetical protein